MSTQGGNMSSGIKQFLSWKSLLLYTALFCAIFSHAATARDKEAVTIGEKTLKSYVGQYRLAPDLVISITSSDGRLYSQLTGQVKAEIFPESQTMFAYKSVAAKIEFVKNGDGKVEKLILHQNGSHEAPKFSDTVPGLPDVVKIDPAILDEYTGSYELQPGFQIMISVSDGHIYAQASGQGKNEIFPESETKFFFKVVDAQISFVRDGDNQVKELILHQNGTHTAQKIK